MSDKSSLIEKLFQVGAHYAYTKSRRHPTVKPFIFGAKNGTEIFDLEKTSDLLNTAKEFVKNLGKEKAIILFVGGKNEAKNAVIKGAEELDMPYVAGRWIGGTFTNFGEIKKRVEKFTKMKAEQEKGDFAKYTKWERMKLQEEMDKLERFFGGIVNMDRLPKAIFAIDPGFEEIAVAEARKSKIPVISLIGSDCDMRLVDYPIVGNDSAKRSIEYFISEIVSAYTEGKNEAKKSE